MVALLLVHVETLPVSQYSQCDLGSGAREPTCGCKSGSVLDICRNFSYRAANKRDVYDLAQRIGISPQPQHHLQMEKTHHIKVVGWGEFSVFNKQAFMAFFFKTWEPEGPQSSGEIVSLCCTLVPSIETITSPGNTAPVFHAGPPEFFFLQKNHRLENLREIHFKHFFSILIFFARKFT